jgi:hypothetical protein
MHRLFVRTLVGAWGATSSVTDLFLEADGGKSGWLCMVIFTELPELEFPRLEWVSSLELPSVEACKRRVSKHKHIYRNP